MPFVRQGPTFLGDPSLPAACLLPFSAEKHVSIRCFGPESAFAHNVGRKKLS
jgi:hypothetical protein